MSGSLLLLSFLETLISVRRFGLIRHKDFIRPSVAHSDGTSTRF